MSKLTRQDRRNYMKGTWDTKKKKYVKTKKEKTERKWIHKNNYHITKYGEVYKVGNKPYVKPKDGEQKENESKD